MNKSLTSQICVSIPHSGLRIPPEIQPDWLSESFATLVKQSNDFFTDSLYNFTDLLGNSQAVFPYTPVVVNANRSPDLLDQAVPFHVRGSPVYRAGCEPTLEMRRALLGYHHAYHAQIQRTPKIFILDGHSTMDGDLDADGSLVNEDIILDDTQRSDLDPLEGLRSAPKGYLETYAEELEKRLPQGIRVSVNSRYLNVYGHVMATHSWDGRGQRGYRAALILQETNERLYMTNGWPNLEALEGLRRIYAGALGAMVEKMARVYGLD